MSSNGLFWIEDPSFGANTALLFYLLHLWMPLGHVTDFFFTIIIPFLSGELTLLSCLCIFQGVPDTLVRKYSILTLRLEKY